MLIVTKLHVEIKIEHHIIMLERLVRSGFFADVSFQSEQ